MELVRRYCSKFVENAVTLSNLIQLEPRLKKVISASFTKLVGYVYENQSVTYIQCNCVVFPTVGFVIHHVIQFFFKGTKIEETAEFLHLCFQNMDSWEICFSSFQVCPICFGF
jgi:hypothetical protein